MPEPIAFGSVETAWGPMQLATTPRGILLIERGDDAGLLMDAAQRRLPRVDLQTGAPEFAAWLARWIEGARRDVPPVDLRGLSAFDAAVYRAVREVGWGDRATYGQIAMAVGRPGGARAVGGAMARCPSSRQSPAIGSCGRPMAGAAGAPAVTPGNEPCWIASSVDRSA